MPRLGGEEKLPQFLVAGVPAGILGGSRRPRRAAAKNEQGQSSCERPGDEPPGVCPPGHRRRAPTLVRCGRHASLELLDRGAGVPRCDPRPIGVGTRGGELTSLGSDPPLQAVDTLCHLRRRRLSHHGEALGGDNVGEGLCAPSVAEHQVVRRGRELRHGECGSCPGEVRVRDADGYLPDLDRLGTARRPPVARRRFSHRPLDDGVVEAPPNRCRTGERTNRPRPRGSGSRPPRGASLGYEIARVLGAVQPSPLNLPRPACV
jgi:hypothetical protein